MHEDCQGCVPGTALPVPHPALQYRSWAGSILLACWGPMGWQGACGELLQLVARKAGLLLGKESFIAVDALCLS